MNSEPTRALISAYYDAFNRQDWTAMLDLLHEEVIHDANQGARHLGKAHFTAFLAHMERCYQERLEELVVLVDSSGTRAAAEFVVHGTYLATDEGLPEAHGQHYVLPAGAFFEVEAGAIRRVTTYYNLQHWLDQIHADS